MTLSKVSLRFFLLRCHFFCEKNADLFYMLNFLQFKFYRTNDWLNDGLAINQSVLKV